MPVRRVGGDVACNPLLAVKDPVTDEADVGSACQLECLPLLLVEGKNVAAQVFDWWHCIPLGTN